jgi:hypothetical protein
MRALERSRRYPFHSDVARRGPEAGLIALLSRALEVMVGRLLHVVAL